MMSLIPPAGTPTSLSEVLKIGAAWFSDELCRDTFGRLIREHTGARHVFFLSSGRAAQMLILQCLYSLDEHKRTEVVIPAYTCFTVPASVARAGLRVRLVDIDPSTLDYHYPSMDSADFTDVLAISSTNLFGIFNDWQRLRQIADRHKAFLVDDAAQAMGGEYHNHAAGTLGDAGLFSLGRGKSLSTCSGGVIVVNDDRIAAALNKQIGTLSVARGFHNLKMFFKIGLYGLFLHPALYWIPASIPFLGLGKTIYDESFEVAGLSEVQMCAGAILFPKLNELQAHRREVSQTLAGTIARDDRFTVPGYREDASPSYLRIPVLARDNRLRDRAVRALRKVGVLSSAMYPSTIAAIPGIESRLANAGERFPGAESVAERLFTLPTHPYVNKKVMDRISQCLKRL
jgi:perosamine synthetase